MHLWLTLILLPCRQTQLPAELVQDFVQDQAGDFTAESYDLFHHNCNHYSNELSNFLVGRGIPVSPPPRSHSSP